MPTERALIIAKHLRDGLIHPGDGKSGPIPLPGPMFRNSSLPDAQAKQFADEAGLPSADIALLYGEALDAILSADHETMTKAEAAQLRADAASGVERHRQPRIRCRACDGFLFSANIDSERPYLDGPQLRVLAEHDCSKPVLQ